MNTVSMVKKLSRSRLGTLGFIGGAAILLALSGTASAQPDYFAPFEVEYAVGNNLISAGSATLKLERAGDNWTYSLNTKPTGVLKLTGKGKIQEVSMFSVGAETDKLNIQPRKYFYRQDNETKRSVDASFDLNNQKLTFTRRGEVSTEDFSGPIYDRLSVTLTVIDSLRSNSLNQEKMNVFDNGRIKSLLFSNEGNEKVTTKGGSLDTIRVKSNTDGSSRHTITWFAPELDYVPVKIEQFKRDKLVARLTLTKLRNTVTDSGGAAAYK